MSNKKKILIIQKVHEKGMELINNHPNFDVEVTDDTSVENLKSKIKDCDGASICLLYTSPSPRDATLSRMPSSA